MKINLLKNLLLLAFFMLGGSAYSQTATGNVSDASGPLPGVNVIVKGTSTGTITDFDGNYTISIKTGDVLVFSFIGFISQEINFTGQPSINVVLEEEANQLDEVVILGYGKTSKKEDLTGAVSVIGIKDIEKAPLVNVDQALQGRASGVQVTQSSGAPGAGFKIRVRGSNSITGTNSPLIVVDGLIDVDINSVNPNDIRSISVLKDASSSAIYGNRAANGVIIITTKKGVKGSSVVEFGTYMSFSNPSNKVDLLSAEEFIDFANFLNNGQAGGALSEFDTEQKIANRISNSVDYQDEVFRTAAAKNYQLSFRGGSENMDYYVSGNLLDQEGIAINTNFKRYALRANINSILSEKLTLNTSINLIRQEGLNNDPGFGADLALGAIGFDKTTPIFDENGNYNRQTTVTSGVQTSVITNPIFRANESNGTSSTNRVQANLGLTYNLIDNLDVNISGGLDYGNIAVATFTPPSTDALNIVANQQAINSNNTQYAVRLNYDNTFNKKHNLAATAIFEERKSQSTNFNANGTGFFTSTTGFDNLGLADVQQIGSGTSSRRLRSSIGRATYNYDSKYLVTASMRYDESSVFLKDQGGIFPSFALGWNINNEDFFKSGTISNLRLRGGWGQTGNELIGTNDALNLLRNNPWIPFGGNGGGFTAILPGTRLANPDLTWETTTQTNIGVDLGILNDRFALSFEYYIKNTEDLLLTRLVPRFTGRVDQVINAGSVQNKGVDLTLTGRIIQKGDFFWDVSANFSVNRNKVTSLIGGETEIFPGLVAGPNIPIPTIIRVGEPIGSFYGFVYNGVDPSNGDAVYGDTNETNNQAIIGDSNPDFTYGINSNISYKGFDLNLFVQGVSGNDIYNRGRSLILGRDGRIPYGTSAELKNTWSPTNTSGTIPSLLATNVQNESSEFIEDGSFLRLKNISLGYSIREMSALNAIGAESLRLYVSAQNLLTITDYSGLDPEVNNGGQDDRLAGVDIGALPTPKTVTLGLNIIF